MPYPPLNRQPVTEPTTVYRFLVSEQPQESDFRTYRELGRHPSGRSAEVPELMDGLSAFRSLETARLKWADLTGK